MKTYPYTTATLFLSESPDLFTFIQQRKKEASDWIHNLSDAQLLSADVQDLLMSQFELSPLELSIDAAEVVNRGSKKVDVKRDSRFAVWAFDDEYVDTHVDGHFVTFAIPYTGDDRLFLMKSNTFPNWNCFAEIDSTEIQITIEDAIAFTKESLLGKQSAMFSILKVCADSARFNALQFNGWLRGTGKELIEKRQMAAQVQGNILLDLGFKIRKRPDQPANVSQPLVQKKQSPVDQLKKTVGTQQSTALDMPVYNEILSICGNMARVMELSPKAFIAIREEDLRFHFLVQLNAVFEGQATGETFNLGGKTDILIKHEGQNLFIAECKYWTGEKDYKDAIDQLMGYVSWHVMNDTVN